MKVYLINAYTDCCSNLIGIFADEQAANEVAEIENEHYESGCHVSELELLQSKEDWMNKEKNDEQEFKELFR